MTASVDIGLRETWDILNCSCKRRVVILGLDMVHEALLGKTVHDPRDEVATDTIWSRIIPSEETWSESTTLNTATTSASGEVKGVLFSCCLFILAVTAESKSLGEDFGLEDGSGVLILRCVQGPVPVSAQGIKKLPKRLTGSYSRLSALILALLPESFLISSDEVPMPQDKEALRG